jgi:hypothetical protein
MSLQVFQNEKLNCVAMLDEIAWVNSLYYVGDATKTGQKEYLKSEWKLLL